MADLISVVNLAYLW